MSFAIGKAADGLRTKAVGDLMPEGTATDEEKALKSLYAVLFEDADGDASKSEDNKNDLFFKCINLTDILDGSDNSVSFNVSTGDYQVCFVANLGLSTLLNIAKLADGRGSVADFKAVVEALDPATKTGGMLMLSDFLPAKVVTDQTTDLGTVYLERAMARIDIVNKASGVTVIDVTFNNRAVKTALVTDNPADAFNADYMEASKTYSLNLVGNSTAEDDDESNKCKAKIYSYEQYGTDDNAPSLTISYTVGDDTSVRTRTVKFEETSIENSETVTHPINLVRNHLYTVNITNTAGRVRFNLTVADWNEGDTFGLSTDELIDGMNPYSKASVGQIMLSDGSIVDAEVVAASTEMQSKAIGVVAYRYPTGDTRTNKAGTHGLVLALKQADAKVAWNNSGKAYGTAYTTFQKAYNNGPDGLTLTDAVINGVSNLSAFPAFNAVKTFRTSNPAPTDSTTDWYLPSIGEWIDMLGTDGLGGVDVSGAKSDAVQRGNSNPICYANLANTARTNIHNVMKTAKVSYDQIFTTPYWTSTERDASTAYGVFFNPQGALYLNIYSKQLNNNNGNFVVRCVLAF